MVCLMFEYKKKTARDFFKGPLQDQCKKNLNNFIIKKEFPSNAKREQRRFKYILAYLGEWEVIFLLFLPAFNIWELIDFYVFCYKYNFNFHCLFKLVL